MIGFDLEHRDRLENCETVLGRKAEDIVGNHMDKEMG